jgi:hypothetical protein
MSNDLLTILPVALPIVVAFIAGLLRQDGLPQAVNEAITVGLLLLAAIGDAIYNHRLTNNLMLDFIVVAGYAAAIVQLPQLQALQGYLQSNALAFIKAAADLPEPPAPPAQIVPLPAKPLQQQAPAQIPPESMNGG